MIAVVGGTYNEKCFHPDVELRFGSGLRACYSIRSLDKDVAVEFHTFSNEENELHLKNFESIFDVKTFAYPSENSVGFYYDHPLRIPVISPRPDLIIKPADLVMQQDHVLYYGFLEGNAQVTGKMVVYDPQSPVKPIPFKQTQSTADHLAVVINIKEAAIIASSKNVDEIRNYFFNEDGAEVLVIKMGAKGAMVFTAAGDSGVIPVYKTNSVYPIGSGDVFAAIFAYYWMEGKIGALAAAEKASFFTAIYCNTRNYRFTSEKNKEEILPLNIKEFPTGQVYLAGPFFNYAQKWVVNEIFDCLIGTGIKVFSPWHHVGVGEPDSNVARDDIDGLEKCQVVFAIVDGLDSGTLFEIGYANKKGIPVIAYVENEKDTDLTMLIGTGCIIESDMTTAIYKCLWLLAENE